MNLFKSIKIIDSGKAIILSRKDGSRLRYHATWLRDNANDPKTRDKNNGQRLISVSDIPVNTYIKSASLDKKSKNITLNFLPKKKQIKFSVSWLENYAYDKKNSNSKVWIDKKKVKITPDGFFVFGLGRDRKYDVVITLNKDGNKQKIVKKVQKRKYNIQKIDGLEEKKVTPPEEVYERIKRENKWIGEVRTIDSDLIFFTKEFIIPVENAIISGVYGSQRILNGKPKWPHYGLDFAADEGTKIKAMLDGMVTLAEPDLFYTGGTLIFDHGHGISTLYMHMEKILVKKGQKVKQGDIIGTVGSTGRATGAHLDVRLNWFHIRLDPATVLDIK